MDAKRARRKTAILLDAAIALVAVAALVAVVLRGKQAYEDRVASASRYSTKVLNWTDYAQHGTRFGPPNPLLTIVEFGDFLCSFCMRASEYLAGLRLAFPDQIAVVYRHYPLDSLAFAAAVASECAKFQDPDLFGAIHDELYRGPEIIGKVPWSQFAKKAGVADTAGFVLCMGSPEAASIVAFDSAAARAAGATGTPMFLINGVRVQGFPGAATMDSLVLNALFVARDRKTSDSR